MRNLVLYIATSLDNYIARPNGDTSWLHHSDFEVAGEDYGYKKFYDSIDTTLMGHNTYKVIQDFDIPFPYTEKTNYVFSRHPQKDSSDVQFVSNEVIRFIQELKKQEGKDIWLIGGSQINSIFYEHGLIDKMILTIMPIVLGKGIPLFNGVVHESKFNLENLEQFKTGVVQLTYSYDNKSLV